MEFLVRTENLPPPGTPEETRDQLRKAERERATQLANIQVGSTRPAAHTSIGKLLLSYLDEEDLRARIVPESFRRGYGPNAKESLKELLAELPAIRAQGWATQDEELAFGLRSVAAPVRRATGLVIAGANISVQARNWPAQRIVRELRPQIAETCRSISGLLGYSGADQ